MKTKFKGIRTAAEYRRGELTKDVLRLIGAGVLVGTVVVAPNMAQLIDYFNPKGRAERKRIWNAIKYLEGKGRVSCEEREDTTFVKLTSQGRLKLDEDAIWELTLPERVRWDHKWRMVMFDVPMCHGHARNAFREKLQDFGFRLYQNSVFIYPHECHEEVIAVARWYGIDKHVRYVVATEIHDMRRFVREFDLL
ncbi:hypothetical protein HY413_01455 [Candidatus Kaiserbacteria bacterium]|nr:hypothetical protein [Candidatus Kaiserbacteria bacterium]